MVTRPDGLVTIIAFLLVYLKCLLLRLSLGAIMSYYTQLVWNYVQFNSLTGVPIMTITLSLSLLLLFQLGVIIL